MDTRHPFSMSHLRTSKQNAYPQTIMESNGYAPLQFARINRIKYLRVVTPICPWKKSRLRERAMPNVPPKHHPLKGDLPHRLIRRAQCRLERRSRRRHAQHPPARRPKPPIGESRAGMKNLDARNLRRLLEPGDDLAALVTAWIALRRRDHAGRSPRLPAKLRVTQPAFDASLERLHQIALHPHQDRLRLRNAEARIKLQQLRPGRGHHQPAVQDADERCLLRGHAVDRLLRDVLEDPPPHRIVEHVVS